MIEEKNKAIVRRFYEELWNARNLAVADEIISTDCVTHQLQSSAETIAAAARGAEAVKYHVAEWLSSFPDLRFEVEDVIAEGDRVMSRSVMRGTHTGIWHGIVPTNESVSIRMIVVQRIADGKVVEDWVLVEALGFFQQLGLLPSTQEIFTKSS